MEIYSNKVHNHHPLIIIKQCSMLNRVRWVDAHHYSVGHDTKHNLFETIYDMLLEIQSKELCFAHSTLRTPHTHWNLCQNRFAWTNVQLWLWAYGFCCVFNAWDSLLLQKWWARCTSVHQENKRHLDVNRINVHTHFVRFSFLYI